MVWGFEGLWHLCRGLNSGFRVHAWYFQWMRFAVRVP